LCCLPSAVHPRLLASFQVISEALGLDELGLDLGMEDDDFFRRF
jgi:hypothetical protein